MGFFKDIQFTVSEPKEVTLTYHDIVGISWSSGSAILQVTVGSWLTKEEFESELDPSKTTVVAFTDQWQFENVSNVIESLVNSDSIFSGGEQNA